jgi:hypothetical protein
MILGLMTTPGCDELVTNEFSYHDSVSLSDSTCVIYCHSDSNSVLEIAKNRWANSGHADNSRMDTTLMGVSSIVCGPKCHTREGFITQSVNLTNYPTGLGCYSCHAPHDYWPDIYLRMDTVRYNDAVTLADGNIYDNGNSNLCVYCHQSLIEKDDLISDSLTISSLVYDKWDTLALHGMSETELLLGFGGYEFDSINGEAVAWNTVLHSHRTADGQKCITCHKEYNKRYDLGGHSFNIVSGSEALVETCNRTGCHAASPLTFASIQGSQQFIEDRLYDLKSELSKAGILDFNMNLPDSNIFIPDSNTVGALFNYFYILNDKSRGMHNFVYDSLLLRTSIDHLRDDIPPPKQ